MNPNHSESVEAAARRTYSAENCDYHNDIKSFCEEGFLDGAAWAIRHDPVVLKLAEAARFVIAENNTVKGWDDLHDAWYSYMAAFDEAMK